MNSYKANFLNSLILILVGFWGYFESSSGTAIIPVVFGWLYYFAHQDLKKKIKLLLILLYWLTFICLLGLFMPLNGAIDRGDNIGILKSFCNDYIRFNCHDFLCEKFYSK
jgi:O-antigen/teichoic acid export membrane protein